MIGKIIVLVWFLVSVFAVDYSLRMIAYRAPVWRYLHWRWFWYCAAIVATITSVLSITALVEMIRLHP